MYPPIRSNVEDMNSVVKKTNIADLRQEIDVVDEKLIKLLAERQRLVEAIIVVKQQEGLPARIPARVDYVVDRARVLARVCADIRSMACWPSDTVTTRNSSSAKVSETTR